MFWILLLPAEAALGGVCGIGLQASVAIHVTAVHQGRSHHKFKTDGTFKFGLVECSTNGSIL